MGKPIEKKMISLPKEYIKSNIPAQHWLEPYLLLQYLYFLFKWSATRMGDVDTRPATGSNLLNWRA
jgi:hypothetical protein